MQDPEESSKHRKQHRPPTAYSRGLCAGATEKLVNCFTQKPLRSNIMRANCRTQKPLLLKYNAHLLLHPEAFGPQAATGIGGIQGPFLLHVIAGKTNVMTSGRKTLQSEVAMSTKHSEPQFSQWRWVCNVGFLKT